MRAPRRTLPLLAVVAVLAGCGGGDVPDGSKAATQFGATFQVPPGLRAGEPKAAGGTQTVSYTGTDAVSLSIRFAPDQGPSFGTYPDQQRAVTEALGGGEFDDEESLDVPGADDAYVLTGTQPARDGSDAAVASVGARRGKDVWVLNVYVTDGADVDPEAVARTLELGDG